MVVLPNIIWIDQNYNGDEIMGYRSELRSLGYLKINCYKNINESIEYLINNIKFEETIIIVSGTLYFPFINKFKEHLNEINVIPKIIIFTSNIQKFKQNNAQDLQNINPFYIKGIHTNFQEIKNFILNQSKGNNKIILKMDEEKDLNFEYIDCQEKLALPMLYKG